MIYRLPAGFALSLALTSLAAAQWPEPDGTLHTRTAIGVDGPRTEPTELWRLDVDEVIGEPVVSEGIVHAVVRSGRKTELVLLSARTGEELSSTKVTAKEFAQVAVQGSTVVCASGDGLRVFERRGDALRKGKVSRGVLVGPASVFPGHAVAAKAPGQFVVIELRSGKRVYEFRGLGTDALVWDHDGRTTLLVPDDRGAQQIQGGAMIKGTVLGLVEAQGAGGRDVTFQYERAPSGALMHSYSTGDIQEPEVIHMGAKPSDYSFLIASDLRMKSEGPRTFRYRFEQRVPAAVIPYPDRDICVAGGVIYGRDVDGALIQQTPDGQARAVLDRASRPDGAVDGPISSAGGILLLGNWALEVETRRILWVAPSLDIDGILIPAADGICVYRDPNGDLVGVGDRRAAGGGVGATLAGGMAAPSRPTLPGTGEAIVLEGGIRIPGAATRAAGGTVTFTAVGADTATTIAADRVAGIERADTLELTGTSYAFYLASRDALDRELADGLTRAFGGYAKRDLLTEARRVLDEISALGLPSDEVRALEESISRRTESTKGNRDKQLAKAKDDERKVRVKALDRVLSAAAWCKANGLGVEASALLHARDRIGLGGEVSKKQQTAIDEAATALVPEAFPFGGPTRAAQWLAWASELAPAGGAFFDLAERTDLNAPWNDATIGLRTTNIELLSRSQDPEIVGACLRHGEGAIRVLQDILDQPPGPADQRLDVRIHGSREDYLSEELKGVKIGEWTLGFYSPMYRASRFHVPNAKTAPVHQGRQLHEVVAHELTHQFIDERWARAGEGVRRTPIIPGYWMVEGFARFIEDQSLESGRRGAGFDDPTVQSVESAAGLMEAGGGFNVSALVPASQMDFGRLTSEKIGDVQLKSTLVRITHTQQTAFYDQAGGLVFFLMNRCGDEGRAKFIEALAAHYRGETDKAGWKALGFADAGLLEKAFHAFLKAPGLPR